MTCRKEEKQRRLVSHVSLTVRTDPDFVSSAERWCEANVPAGQWLNEQTWFSFQHSWDAEEFREYWGV